MERGQSGEPLSNPTYQSSWSFNWGGAITVLVVVVLALLVSQRFGGDDPTDADADDAAATTVPSTTVVAATTTSTVVSATTTRPPSTTSTTAPGPRVLIRGEVEPCRFGSECLVAHFRIEGFDQHPGRFTCIYPNSTSEFGFNDDDVEEACLSGDEGDTIAIEVAGVRSATISAEHLDGRP